MTAFAMRESLRVENRVAEPQQEMFAFESDDRRRSDTGESDDDAICLGKESTGCADRHLTGRRIFIVNAAVVTMRIRDRIIEA